MRPARRRPTLGEVEDPPELRPALGEQEADEQDAVFEADEVRARSDPDDGRSRRGPGWVSCDSDQASLEFLGEDELREGETDDAIEATEEGVDGVTEVIDRLEVQGIG